MNAASAIETAPPSISASPAISTMRGSVNAPATPEVTANDATNPSFSPRTGLFYLNARENYSTLFFKGPQTYEEGNRYDGRGRHPFTFHAVVGDDDDKYTAVRALDPQTGERKWEFKLNTGNSLHTFEGWQTAFGAAGILTTTSDVLFTGGREGTFVALDARNGSPLWKAILGGPMIMNPITYAVDGKQYVAINAGSSLFVFGLR